MSGPHLRPSEDDRGGLPPAAGLALFILAVLVALALGLR